MAENQREQRYHEPVAGTSEDAASNQQEQQQRERRCSFCECFRMRAEQQQQDLRDLVNIRTHHIHNEQAIRRAIARSMQHYLDYSRMRAFIARSNVPAVCSPSCSSTFCNSFLWLGGCRPTAITRLVYVMAGQEVEGQLWELLQDVDKLRLQTLAKTIEILTITQALDLLITGAQLHICVGRQGKRWDRTHAS